MEFSSRSNCVLINEFAVKLTSQLLLSHRLFITSPRKHCRAHHGPTEPIDVESLTKIRETNRVGESEWCNDRGETAGSGREGWTDRQKEGIGSGWERRKWQKWIFDSPMWLVITGLLHHPVTLMKTPDLKPSASQSTGSSGDLCVLRLGWQYTPGESKLQGYFYHSDDKLLNALLLSLHAVWGVWWRV